MAGETYCTQVTGNSLGVTHQIAGEHEPAAILFQLARQAVELAATVKARFY